MSKELKSYDVTFERTFRYVVRVNATDQEDAWEQAYMRVNDAVDPEAEFANACPEFEDVACEPVI